MNSQSKVSLFVVMNVCATLGLSSCTEMGIDPTTLTSFTPFIPGGIDNLFPPSQRGAVRAIIQTLRALDQYSADARQREFAQSRARGRTGTYYVKVPPKKGYTGPSGTHLVPYKNGAVAGNVKVVDSPPASGQKISINGTQGTVL